MNSTFEVVEHVEITLRKRKKDCSKAMRRSDILPEDSKECICYVSKERMTEVSIDRMQERMTARQDDYETTERKEKKRA